MHAGVRIEAEDRAGLERLLRYCARPAFASERLTWDGPDQPVRYTLAKLLPSGQAELTLAPLELLDRVAAQIPPTRRHRHHYAGVFSPHASLRARVTACAWKPVTESAMAMVPQPDPTRSAATRRRASIFWARLLARIYETRPLSCPRCQSEMRLVALLTEPLPIRTILARLGESPPCRRSPRAPASRPNSRPNQPPRPPSPLPVQPFHAHGYQRCRHQHRRT